MNWRCKLFGHHIEPVGAYYYSVDRCFRCSPYGNGCALEVYGAGWREWIKVRARLGWLWLLNEIDSVRRWWRCPYCDERYGKHNETNCLPF